MNEKKTINNNNEQKLEDNINVIYDRINSKFGTSATDDNLNFERENVLNDYLLNKIKFEQFSLNDIKNSFNSNNETYKSTIVEKSINFDSIINVEITNNLNTNLKENEILPNNQNNEIKNDNDKNKKSNIINNEDKLSIISMIKNDISNNNILIKEIQNKNKKKNSLHLINRINIKNKEKTSQKSFKKICKKILTIKSICIFCIIIIILLILIFQIYLLIDFF